MADYLDENKYLKSPYWIDQPDAADRVTAIAAKYTLPEHQQQELHRFIKDGYAILSATPQTLELVEAMTVDIERAWQDQEWPFLFAGLGGNRTVLHGLDPAVWRKPGYRFPDIHGHSKACADLILLEETFSFIDALFDAQAVAFQSLYFEWGSQQSLHRDPMFVRTNPPSALLATWLALEDIHPDSGPLVYIPGSHRYPYFEFVPGDVYMNKERSFVPRPRRAFREHYLALMARHGHQEQRLTCKKGDILVWHGSLIHGGSPVVDPQRTRRSLVVHYTEQARISSVSNSLYARDRETGKAVKKVKVSSEVISKGRARLFTAPFTKDILHRFVTRRGLTALPNVTTADY
jgi:hypothetical protein